MARQVYIHPPEIIMMMLQYHYIITFMAVYILYELYKQ